MKPPRVEVEWTDAVTWSPAEVSLSDVVTHRHCQLVKRRHTSGYLAFQDNERVVVAADYDPPSDDEPSGTIGTITVIPAGWVVAIRYHRKPRNVKEPTE